MVKWKPVVGDGVFRPKILIKFLPPSLPPRGFCLKCDPGNFSYPGKLLARVMISCQVTTSPGRGFSLRRGRLGGGCDIRYSDQARYGERGGGEWSGVMKRRSGWGSLWWEFVCVGRGVFKVKGLINCGAVEPPARRYRDRSEGVTHRVFFEFPQYPEIYAASIEWISV